jgi:hypothetical protein
MTLVLEELALHQWPDAGYILVGSFLIIQVTSRSDEGSRFYRL